jgi:aminoglycoside 2'-N-acetyltransferase I
MASGTEGAGMELRVEILSAEQITCQRVALLEAVYEREFGWDRLRYASPQWYLLGMFAGTLIGSVRMLERTVTVNDAPLRVGGMTSVVTEPDYRRRGVARRLVGDAVAFLRDERRLPFVILTCNRKLGPLYEKLGWRVVRGPTVYAQPDGPRTCPGLTMVFECGPARWPDGPIDMQGLPW